jgi:hypothetical protein
MLAGSNVTLDATETEIRLQSMTQVEENKIQQNSQSPQRLEHALLKPHHLCQRERILIANKAFDMHWIHSGH